VLAITEIQTPAATAFCFRVIERDDGVVDAVIVRALVKGLEDRLRSISFNTQHFIDEWFDRASANAERTLRLDELVKSSVGGQLMALLVDVHNALQYMASRE
jgi:hypothetical protein